MIFMSLIRCTVSMLSKKSMNIIANMALTTAIMALLFFNIIKYVTSLDCDVLASLLIRGRFGYRKELYRPSLELLNLSKY